MGTQHTAYLLSAHLYNSWYLLYHQAEYILSAWPQVLLCIKQSLTLPSNINIWICCLVI